MTRELLGESEGEFGTMESVPSESSFDVSFGANLWSCDTADKCPVSDNCLPKKEKSVGW